MTEKKTHQNNNTFFPILSKYDMSKIKIEDKGLERYINIKIDNFYVGSVYSNKLFGKSKISIVERMVNNIMRTEKYNGKKIKAYKIVRDAFVLMDKKKRHDH